MVEVKLKAVVMAQVTNVVVFPHLSFGCVIGIVSLSRIIVQHSQVSKSALVLVGGCEPTLNN